jgi:CRP/FNR family transcriptional regulator, cyclic AMP receptor protein
MSRTRIASHTIASMPETKPDHALTLSRVPMFADLADPELAYLTQRAVPRRFSAGETVFSEGQPCTGMYVVESGSIRIFKISAAGREQVLGIDGPGSSVAELPIFDGGNYPASVAAMSDCTLLFISKQDFQNLCLAHPQVALKVLRVVGGRLRRLVGIIEELSFTTVRHRLIALLVREATSAGKKTVNGVEFTLPVNNQELAAQLGTVRELISRNLSRLQSEGLIAVAGRTVTVLDLKALQSEMESAA